MLKQANKWLKDTIKPYKYEDQKIRDQRQLIDGIVNFVVGTIQLAFKLINLMLIVPIKALITDYERFTDKYKEIGQGDIDKLVPTFQRAVTGFVQLLTSPIIPFRIILRMMLTPRGGVSVFANEGLKSIVNEYLQNTPAPEQSSIQSFAVVDNTLPDEIYNKAEKYKKNHQKDSSELNKILSKPILNFYKMREIKTRIEKEVEIKRPYRG